jgi:thymidylate kinase
LAFHQRLREGYLLLAAKHPARFRVIDGAPNAGIVWEQTRAALDELLEKRR